MVYDGYPSSHPVEKPNIETPYELEAYFDIIESSKAAAIIRMVEYEQPGQVIVDAMIVSISFSFSFKII